MLCVFFFSSQAFYFLHHEVLQVFLVPKKYIEILPSYYKKVNKEIFFFIFWAKNVILIQLDRRERAYDHLYSFLAVVFWVYQNQVLF